MAMIGPGSSAVVLHWAGGSARQTALGVCTECARRDVPFRCAPLADWKNCAVWCYSILVIVLDECVRGWGSPDVEELIKWYTYWRPTGLDDVENGASRVEAGIPLLVGPPDCFERMNAATRQRVAVEHDLEAALPANILDGRPDSGAPSVGSAQFERLWSELQAQQHIVGDMATARDLLRRVVTCRERFEDPNRPSLYRPLSHIPRHRDRNRYDLILHPATRDEVGGSDAVWEQYMDNGRRCLREAIEELQESYPDLRFSRTRGAQERFRRLYKHLQLVCDGTTSL